jgi:hypothetical protein
MQIASSALVSLALGAVLVLAPGLGDVGPEFAYDHALAAKGGNGKGNGHGAGNGKSGKGNNGGKSASAGQSAGTSSSKSMQATADPAFGGKQKNKDKQLALSDPDAPAHPSMLGRWNAAKPIDHPAIQAHIRKGKFNGTIGMIAAYAKAQSDYNSMEASLADAQATVDAGEAAAALDQALKDAGYINGYADLEAYRLSGVVDPEVAAAIAALGEQAVPTPEELDAAQAVIAAGEQALDDLAAAEASMEAFSNRAAWSNIRDDVRAKMGLDPAENDLETGAPQTTPAAP